MNELKKYWNGLAARERLLLVVGGVLLFVFLLYNFYFKPFYEKLERNKNNIHNVRQAHSDILKKVEIAKRLQGNKTEVDKPKLEIGNVLGIIEQTATRYKINDKINKIQPVGQTKIDIQYKNVAFDDWLKWNNEIAQQGIDSESVSVNTSENDLVSIRQTLNID